MSKTITLSFDLTGCLFTIVLGVLTTVFIILFVVAYYVNAL